MGIDEVADGGVPELAGVKDQIGTVISDVVAYLGRVNSVFIFSLVPDNHYFVLDS